jgi:selT/selW/selH-like putative selenoprotein
LAAAIKAKLGKDAVQVDLVKGARGAFEIFRDDALVFSKLREGRFPSSDDEVVGQL